MENRVAESRYPLGVALVVLAILVVAGCRQVEETQNPISSSLEDLGATAPADLPSTSRELARIQFDDIPVPERYLLRNHRNESYSFVDGAIRIGRFVYWGSGPPEELRAFYVTAMPRAPYGWTFEGEENGVLRFSKPGQRCEVKIERERRRRGGGWLAIVSVEST